MDKKWKAMISIQRIKDAGLQNEIDDFIQVENNYRIKKIGKYSLFSQLNFHSL